MYDLTVRASDQGAQSRSATTTITVFTRSRTNTGPAFTQTRYNAQVSENRPEGTPVTQVTARYASSAVASSVAYYLTDVTSGGVSVGRLFRVQPATGAVTTAQALDRDAGFTEYTLDIYAIDQDSAAPKTTKTQVRNFHSHFKQLNERRYFLVFLCLVGRRGYFNRGIGFHVICRGELWGNPTGQLDIVISCRFCVDSLFPFGKFTEPRVTALLIENVHYPPNSIQSFLSAIISIRVFYKRSLTQ